MVTSWRTNNVLERTASARRVCKY